MKKIILLYLISFSQLMWGQTNPAEQSLPYFQNFSTLDSSSTTYPVGWQGWMISTSPSSSFNINSPTADRTLTASGTAAITAGNVYNYNGKIGYLNTSSLDLSIVLSLSTTGKENIQVTYDIMTIRNPYDGNSNTRINEVTLQYRVGIFGNFTNLNGVEYRNNTTTQTGSGTDPQNLETKSVTLPSSCDDQQVVQIRWASRQVSGSGSRPSFAFDNIFIIASDRLPVELISFTALTGENGVQLNWSTATEVNNYGFDILRQAQDDNNWEKIGFVQGHGNSNSPKDYLFVDANPPAGKVLYKLKQIDFDGAFEYSKVVEVNVDTPQEFRLAQNYPNPFNPSTVISYQLPMDGNVTLKVYDMLGKEVTTLVNEFQRAGSYNYQFSINNLQLSSGVYYYRLQSGNFVETKKFIVMK